MHANRLSRQHQRLQYAKRAGPNLCPLDKQCIPLSRSTTQVHRLQYIIALSKCKPLLGRSSLFHKSQFSHKRVSFGK